MLNVAAGKAPMQSSVAEGGIPQKAIDGSTSTFFDTDTCSLTEVRASEAGGAKRTKKGWQNLARGEIR